MLFWNVDLGTGINKSNEFKELSKIIYLDKQNNKNNCKKKYKYKGSGIKWKWKI